MTQGTSAFVQQKAEIFQWLAEIEKHTNIQNGQTLRVKYALWHEITMERFISESNAFTHLQDIL